MQVQVQMPECLNQEQLTFSRESMQSRLVGCACLGAARIRGTHVEYRVRRSGSHLLLMLLQPLEQQVGRGVESGPPHTCAGRPWPRLGCCTLTLQAVKHLPGCRLVAELASSGTCTRNSNPALHASMDPYGYLPDCSVPFTYTAPTAIANANANTNTSTCTLYQLASIRLRDGQRNLLAAKVPVSHQPNRLPGLQLPFPTASQRSITASARQVQNPPRTTKTTCCPWKNPRRLADASLTLPPSMHAMGRHDMTPARASGPPGRLSQAKLASWDSTMEKLLKIQPRRSRRALPALKHTAKLALPPASPSNLP